MFFHMFSSLTAPFFPNVLMEATAQSKALEEDLRLLRQQLEAGTVVILRSVINGMLML